MRVGGGGESLDVEHGEGGVGDGLAEDGLRVGLEGGIELLIGAIGRDEGALQAHALHGMGQQVVRAAVDGRARDHVVAAPGDIEDSEEVRGLAGARQHRGGSALELADLGCDGVVGGVLQARVEVAGLLEVEQLAHVLGRVVLPRGRLVDGNLAGFGVTGAITALYARRSDMLCHKLLLLCTACTAS